ncbi:MAG: hypothetical protein U1D69_12820 [Polynucleobacter sp.]|uniref:hypothetical protein n=1 Tax=Limnobacter sp. TaxID=2003368 RepID=UPI002735AEEA|nr:hypothetical protein [Limnobacter sp.]MDP3273406.1 hypothetical protein [Limnobacter sp.]MDZ4057815.1 hypothetical protein [Polynucleobacter sp.]
MNENDKQAEPVDDHSGLINRIDAAIERVTQGRGLMSIPADPRSDVDLVLSECKALLQGENPPFWAKDFHPTPTVPHGLVKAAFDWIEYAPHGDNCFVSDNYEGDPGNQCNCGKDSLLSAYEEFGQPEAPAFSVSEPMPTWMRYDPVTDVLIIHGKKYAVALFGRDGFLGDPGDLLRIEKGGDDVVAVTKILADQQAEPVAWAETDEHGEIAWGEEGCFSNDPAWIENPLPLYTNPAPDVAQEPMYESDLAYSQGIQAVAKMLDTKADDYAKEFGFDDMGALEFSRESQREYHSTLIELAEEIRSMEATNSTPTVAQGEPRFPFAGFDPNFCPGSNPENPQEAPAVAHPPAEVVRELYDTLQAIIADGVHCDVVPHLHRRGIAALKSAKEHGL